jgi:hypothetical protein
MKCSQCQNPLGQNTFLGENGTICLSCHELNQQMEWNKDAEEATKKEWKPWSIMTGLDLVVYVLIPLACLIFYLVFR